MAKYPVEYTDDEGVNDAVNYLLSGPSGLGQNFAGFSSSTTGYLTGNFRVPFAQTSPANLYVAPIALGTSEMLDGRTWKFTFASAQTSPPFALGNNIEVVGVTDSFYDGVYRPIGVVECTTTYVIARTSTTYDLVPPSSGGTVGLNPAGGFNSTDCNARVTVTSPTDRVFISAQLNEILSYLATETSSLAVTVAVNRYKGSLNIDPINPDYIFDLDETVAFKTYNYNTLDPITNTVLSLDITSGTNHISRDTYPTTYAVNPITLTGSGSGLSLDIELKPAVSTSSVGLSSGGPYFLPSPTGVPYRTEPWNYKTPSAVVEAAGILTITVTNSAPAFSVGQSVTLTGADPYNGTYKITAATPTYIQVDTSVTGLATLSSPQIFNPYYNTTITIQGAGSGYQVGDTLQILGSQIGGADDTNDMFLTVAGVSNSTSTSLTETDTVFASIIDKPTPGYYWYILEVGFEPLSGDVVITQDQMGFRALSAQVVKE